MSGFYNGNISSSMVDGASVSQVSIGIGGSTAFISIVEKDGKTSYSLKIVDAFGQNETASRFREHGPKTESIVKENLTEILDLLDTIHWAGRHNYSLT